MLGNKFKDVMMLSIQCIPSVLTVSSCFLHPLSHKLVLNLETNGLFLAFARHFFSEDATFTAFVVIIVEDAVFLL